MNNVTDKLQDGTDLLTDVYTLFLEHYKLPSMSADELIWELPRQKHLTAKQVIKCNDFLHRFVDMWYDVQDIDDYNRGKKQ